jgi:hypothetical protein
MVYESKLVMTRKGEVVTSFEASSRRLWGTVEIRENPVSIAGLRAEIRNRGLYRNQQSGKIVPVLN